MGTTSGSENDDVALAVQIHRLLAAEREWTEARFARLESQIIDGNEGIQNALNKVQVQLAGLRCAEHRKSVQQLRGDVEKLRDDVKRRQLLWSGTGFAGGLAAAAAAIVSFLKGSN